MKNKKRDWFILGVACLFFGISWTTMTVLMELEFFRLGGAGLQFPYLALSVSLGVIPTLAGVVCVAKGIFQKK